MSSSITPTIGRKVWLWVPKNQVPAEAIQSPLQAFDATIIFVHPNGEVNVSFFDHCGGLGGVHEVELLDPKPEDQHPEGGQAYATWMPYQVNQAKQQFAEAKSEEDFGNDARGAQSGFSG